MIKQINSKQPNAHAKQTVGLQEGLMDAQKLHYLNALGIQPWQQRAPAASLVTPPPAASDEWDTLRTAVAACTACSLHKTRKQIVFGVGNRNADLMIIGEAPGFYEDQKGEPFVGRAGQLLNAMLASIGIQREQVYIANILKCRPPNNRDPSPEEVGLCTPFLKKQIALIQPVLLLGLGRIAGNYLLNTQSPLNRLRGKLHTYGDIPLLITYHPAYLLRNPSDKRKSFQDLQLAAQTLRTLKPNAHPLVSG